VELIAAVSWSLVAASAFVANVASEFQSQLAINLQPRRRVKA
jgi:hypothetical protein